MKRETPLMKKVLFMLAIVIITSAAVHAQKAEFLWDRATMKEIGCSEEQIQKVFALKKKALAERQAIMDDTTTSEETKRKKRKELLLRRNEAILLLLEPDQREKALELQKKVKEANRKKQG